MTPPRRVTLAGAATRALAQSAARLGWQVTAVDAFGDVDLRAVARVIVAPRDPSGRFGAMAAARLARGIGGPVVYTSNFDNHPAAVARLGDVWGNPPEVLIRARNPVRLMRALARAGFAVPATRLSSPPAADRRTWLVKPRRSGGGVGIRPWHRGEPVGSGAYVQERIDGIPASVLFVADGRRARPIGLSRQLVGLRAFGADGFRYAGSVLCRPGDAPWSDEGIVERAVALADAVTRSFGLIGVNGIDVMIRDGVPYPIEVNPRWCASMELIERATALNLFEAHVAACRGSTEAWSARDEVKGIGVWAKAVLYARRALRAPDLARLMDQGLIADVPHPGEVIGRGQPICTVFARGASPERAIAMLERRAARVYHLLEASKGAA